MPVVPIIERNVAARPIGTPGQLSPVPNPYIKTESLAPYLEKASETITMQERENQKLRQQALTKMAEEQERLRKEAIKRADEAKVNEAQAQIDTWETNNIYDANNGALSQKGKNAFDLHNTVSEKFKKDMAELRKQMVTPEQQLEFDKKVTAAGGRMSQTVNAHQRTEMDGYRKTAYEAQKATTLNRASRDAASPDQFEATVNEAKVTAVKYHQAEGAPDAVIMSEVEKVDAQARYDALQHLADADPAKAVDFYNTNINKFGDHLTEAAKLIIPTERKVRATQLAAQTYVATGPVVTPQQSIKFIATNLEGAGFAKDGSYMGIDPRWHKASFDFANPTPEKAEAWYKKEMWDAGGVDKMPPAMQLVAMDTFVQHGLDADSKKMIDDANGDPNRLMQIRAEKYKELAKKPENADKYQGWQNRLAKLALEANQRMADKATKPEAHALIDANTNDLQIAEDAKKLYDQQYDLEIATQKEAWASAEEEWYTYHNAGQIAPPSVEARVQPKRLAEMKKGEDAFDPRVYETARQAVLTSQPVELAPLRPYLGESGYKELVDIQQDPDKQANSKLTDEVFKETKLAIFGSDPSTMSNVDARKRNEWRRVYDQEVKAEEKRTGGKLDRAASQKIADRLVIEGKVVVGKGFFGGPDEKETYLYQVNKREQKSFYTDVPDDVTREAIHEWMLRQKGYGVIPFGYFGKDGMPTEDGMIRTYTQLRQRGFSDADIQGGW